MRVCVCVCMCTCTQAESHRWEENFRKADAKALGQAAAEAVLEPVTGRRAKPLGVLRLG